MKFGSGSSATACVEVHITICFIRLLSNGSPVRPIRELCNAVTSRVTSAV
jgi:hypothetical protein